MKQNMPSEYILRYSDNKNSLLDRLEVAENLGISSMFILACWKHPYIKD